MHVEKFHSVVSFRIEGMGILLISVWLVDPNFQAIIFCLAKGESKIFCVMKDTFV